MTDNKLIILMASLFISWNVFAEGDETQQNNFPNLKTGDGITFTAADNSFSTTMKLRLQDVLQFDLDEDMSHTNITSQVRKMRLRFNGFVFSTKIQYLVQLGFTPNDSKATVNGRTNVLFDGMVFYHPNEIWNIGFGQQVLRAARARTVGSGNMQFVDRSIAINEFQIDRDFGFHGEFAHHIGKQFVLAAKGAVTTGEGRNWESSSYGGLSYTGRLELFPLGLFTNGGENVEGDYGHESTPKIMLGGSYNYNNRAMRLQGQRGDLMPDNETRNIGTYFIDLTMKYDGFALMADYMGRHAHDPFFEGNKKVAVFNGKGMNVQSSYSFRNKWELALRYAQLRPDDEIRPFAGYKSYDQSTLGITRYLNGHKLKLQANASYSHKHEAVNPDYSRWTFQFLVEIGI